MIGLPLMVLLGMGVRGGATPVDAWLQQAHGTPLSSLLVFTDYRTAQALLITSLVVSLYRRLWALLPLIVVLPLVAVAASSVLKPVFGRMKEQGLAYPSGHTTVMVVLLGVLILAVGIRRWLIWAAAAFAVLGILGQSVTYHYFTDGVGSVLLGTSLVCLAVAALRWARRRTRGWLRLRL
jgi:membrane-associated phospholipid phosphatase